MRVFAACNASSTFFSWLDPQCEAGQLCVPIQHSRAQHFKFSGSCLCGFSALPLRDSDCNVQSFGAVLLGLQVSVSAFFLLVAGALAVTSCLHRRPAAETKTYACFTASLFFSLFSASATILAVSIAGLDSFTVPSSSPISLSSERWLRLWNAGTRGFLVLSALFSNATFEHFCHDLRARAFFVTLNFAIQPKSTGYRIIPLLVTSLLATIVPLGFLLLEIDGGAEISLCLAAFANYASPHRPICQVQETILASLGSFGQVFEHLRQLPHVGARLTSSLQRCFLASLLYSVNWFIGRGLGSRQLLSIVSASLFCLQLFVWCEFVALSLIFHIRIRNLFHNLQVNDSDEESVAGKQQQEQEEEPQDEDEEQSNCSSKLGSIFACASFSSFVSSCSSKSTSQSSEASIPATSSSVSMVELAVRTPNPCTDIIIAPPQTPQLSTEGEGKDKNSSEKGSGRGRGRGGGSSSRGSRTRVMEQVQRAYLDSRMQGVQVSQFIHGVHI